MKNLIVVLSLIIFACAKPAKTPVDINIVKGEINSMLDQFHATMIAKNAEAQAAMFTDDGIFCGTDPTEVWDKKTITDYLTKAFADTAMLINKYSIDRREIKVDDDGQCAYILDQFTMDVISTKMPIRFTGHVIKQNDKWVFDFTSFAIIPKNEEMGRLNDAIK